MNILICGASGFVGRHIRDSLQKAGHQVIGAVRQPRCAQDIAVDFCNDTNKKIWLPRIENIDVVINAVGVLRDNRNNPMQLLHQETPLVLFEACREVGMKRIVHISALGVDSGVNALYFSSRLAAEEALREMPTSIHWLCLRPSVIYGEDGGSARMFRQLSRLPVHMLPMGGEQALQPVHIDDICIAITHWLENTDAESLTVAAVGADSTTMRGMLDSYRMQSGHCSPCHIAIPKPLVQVAARIGDLIPASPLCSDTLAMMDAGNTADSSEFTKLLNRAPKSYREFIQ